MNMYVLLLSFLKPHIFQPWKAQKQCLYSGNEHQDCGFKNISPWNEPGHLSEMAISRTKAINVQDEPGTFYF